MFVSFKLLLEQRTRRSQDHRMCLKLFAIFTSKSHIREVLIASQITKAAFTHNLHHQDSISQNFQQLLKQS